MTAVVYDLHIEQGTVYSVSWEYREDDGSDPPTGPLIDISDYTPILEIRTRPGGLLMAEFDVDSGLSAEDGVVTLRIGAEVTATLTRNGSYDLELHHLTDESNVVRLSQGDVLVSREVTQA